MKPYLLLSLGFLFYLPMISAAENPHEINKLEPSESCLSCHVNLPKNPLAGKEGRFIIPNRANYKGDGVALCAGCHDPKRASHMVGKKIDIPLPAELPLAADGKIECLTCHYTHGSFYTEQPRAHINFFDKLFNTDRMHNSYLLRLNNTEGEFCLLCHSATDKRQENAGMSDDLKK